MAEDVEGGAADRLIFFSDAVVAIAMTLLALELPVPTGHSTREFWSSVQDNEGEYLAFLISFAVIARHWFAHHAIFRYLSRGDEQLRLLNMGWLLTIVLMPFATKLLSASADEASATTGIRFGFYAALQVVAFVVFRMMVHRMVNHELVGPDTPPNLLQVSDRRGIGLIAGFALSIPLFFATQYAWVLWILGPAIGGFVSRHEKLAAPRAGD